MGDESVVMSADFPLDHLLPKKETGVEALLTKHPSYDGRGCLMAILDNGVDPAAPGMRVTSEGKVKVADLYDCSGAGDVDTSAVRLQADGQVEGLTGRKLNIPADWTNPSGRYHLGVVHLYNFFWKGLASRVKTETKEKVWLPAHRLATADVHRQLDAHKTAVGDNPTSLADRQKREDLAAQLDTLKDLEKTYADCGPTADCLVFHDGATWKACIDTSFRGKLDQCQCMASYREAFEFATFSAKDLQTYSFNIHDNGDLLEVVSTAGQHGTHVASIAAACFADEPARNGSAPGAQVVSLSIGDRRLGEMETTKAITRALNKCVELRVDLINMSYGEATRLPDSGCVTRAIQQVVWQHGIIFVGACANHGPALSTAGAPGGTGEAAIAVGAYLTPEMTTDIYGAREKLPASIYPWSSRGPLTNGALSPTLVAPGAAITSVPRCSLESGHLMNGTSMSSPNAAGAIACLLSALKSEGLSRSAFVVRLALENSCKAVGDYDALSVGRGLLQVEGALAFMRKYDESVPAELVGFKLRANGGVCGREPTDRGIYLREAADTKRPRDCVVSVEPFFSNDCGGEVKASFVRNLVLCGDASWLSFPKRLTLTTQKREFRVLVNADGLVPGRLYYTELRAFDSNLIEAGPLWRLPITVVVPLPLTDAAACAFEVSSLSFRPSTLHRSFIRVPDGAQWASLEVRTADAAGTNGRFMLHAVQLLPMRSYSDHETHFKLFEVNDSGKASLAFAVVGGRTLELCMTKWWSNYGQSTVSYLIKFRSLAPLQNPLQIMHTDCVSRFDVRNSLVCEECSPTINLKHFVQILKPKEVKGPQSLGARDLFFDGRQIYRLLLTYEFSIHKTSEVSADMPGLSDHLYEEELNGYSWMIFSAGNEHVASGANFSSRYSAKLDKGDYRLVVQLRHESAALLDKFVSACASLRHKLAAPVAVDCFGSLAAAIALDGKKFAAATLEPDAIAPVFVAPLAADKLPKGASAGTYLEGSLVLTKDELGRRARQFPVTYLIGENARRKSGGASPAPLKNRTKKQEFAEAMRDLKISWLPKLLPTDADEVYRSLCADFDSHLPLHQANLQRLSSVGATDVSVVKSTSDKIISLVDQDALLRWLGTKADLSDSASDTRSQMETQKAALVEALVGGGNALADRLLAASDDAPPSFRRGAPNGLDSPAKAAKASPRPPPSNGASLADKRQTGSEADFQVVDAAAVADESPSAVVEKTTQPSGTLEELDKLYVELMKWTEASDAKVVMFAAKHAVAHGCLGSALQLLRRAAADRPSRAVDALVVELSESLGWPHVAQYQRNWSLVKYPPALRLF